MKHASVARPILLAFGPCHAAEPDPMPELDASTIEKVSAQVAPGAASIGRFRMTTSRDVRLANGSVIHSDVDTQYLLLESGLWGTSSEASTSGAVVGSGRSESLQLCGLVELLQTTASTQPTTTPLVIPIGRLFVPFGFQGVRENSGSRRVAAFDSDDRTLCAPRPGSRFGYRVTTDNVVHFGSRVVRTTVSRDFTCVVDEALAPTDERLVGAGATYRPVSCDSSGGAPASYRLAYLPEHRYYVVLEVREGGGPSTRTERHVLTRAE